MSGPVWPSESPAEVEPTTDNLVTLSATENATAAELGHRFTIKEAAEACGKSRDVIKRRLVAGRYPNAVKGDGKSDPWMIPLGDLLQDGLTPNRLGQVETLPEGSAPPVAQPSRVAELEAEVRRLRDVLEERDRALRIAERALAALPAPVDHQADAPPAEAEPHPPRRRWFRR